MMIRQKHNEQDGQDRKWSDRQDGKQFDRQDRKWSDGCDMKMK